MGDIRIGEVSSVDVGKRLVRVYFNELEMMSGWLKVIVPGWFPKVKDKVVCIYGADFNGDGYVIGGI